MRHVRTHGHLRCTLRRQHFMGLEAYSRERPQSGSVAGLTSIIVRTTRSPPCNEITVDALCTSTLQEPLN